MCLATIPADRSSKVKKVSGRASESDHTLISDVLTADQSPSRHGGVRVWPRARGVVLNTGICISGRPHSTHTTHTKSGPQSTTRHLSEDTGDSLIVTIQAAGSAALAPSGARTGVGPRPDSSSATPVHPSIRHHSSGKLALLTYRSDFPEPGPGPYRHIRRPPASSRASGIASTRAWTPEPPPNECVCMLETASRGGY